MELKRDWNLGGLFVHDLAKVIEEQVRIRPSDTRVLVMWECLWVWASVGCLGILT